MQMRREQAGGKRCLPFVTNSYCNCIIENFTSNAFIKKYCCDFLNYNKEKNMKSTTNTTIATIILLEAGHGGLVLCFFKSWVVIVWRKLKTILDCITLGLVRYTRC